LQKKYKQIYKEKPPGLLATGGFLKKEEVNNDTR